MKRKILIKNLEIGGDSNIKIQSMTNTKTSNVLATIEQIKQLEKVGCDIVRVSVPDKESALAISDIKKEIDVPLVADIHFDYKLAIESIKSGVDKIRFNPGNIGCESNVKYLVDVLKEYNIPVRIGVNSGSIEKEFLHLSLPEGMCKSVFKHLRLLEKFGYYNIVLSAKASNVQDTITTYRLIDKECDYPLHLGVTEAGVYEDSLIASSIGIGSLLADNIGDTIRVSITGDPTLEVTAAKGILKALNKYDKPFVKVVSCPTCARTEIPVEMLVNQVKKAVEGINKNLTIAIMGCVVNGPGESKRADIGIAGGKDKSVIFKNGQILKVINNNDGIVDYLVQLIKEI